MERLSTKAKRSSQDPLVGKWFHSIVGKCEGCGQDILSWQGQVLVLVVDDAGKMGD